MEIMYEIKLWIWKFRKIIESAIESDDDGAISQFICGEC